MISIFSAYTISENSGLASVVNVRRSHAFGDVTIRWRALTSLPYMISDESPESETSLVTSLDLSEQLVESSGSTLCLAHRLTCEINVVVKEDQVSSTDVYGSKSKTCS